MRFRYLLYALLCSIFGCAAAHAQNTQPRNCSVITDQVTGGSHGAHNCNAWIWTYFSHYTDVWTITYTCWDTNTATSYGGGPVPPNGSITTNGECTTKLTTPFSGVVDCPGYYTTKYLGATNMGQNNAFYWYPNDRKIVGQLSGQLTCEAVPQPTVFAVCTSHWCVTRSSPILMDLDNTGFKLTSLKNGVTFDINGDGKPVKTAWTEAGSNTAFLTLPNADGKVINGNQLFGNQHAANGFIELAVYDDPKNGGNGDGILDARDGIWSSLRVWIDKNHDGICTKDEMYTLESVGVNSISLHYKEDRKTDEWGNEFRYVTRMNPDHPDQVDHKAYDVFFVTVCLP